jgi:hypothetical protein
MNPSLNVKTYATKMGPDTEEMFDDDWSDDDCLKWRSMPCAMRVYLLYEYKNTDTDTWGAACQV